MKRINRAPQAVNDVHSALNGTCVARIIRPWNETEVIRTVKIAAARGEKIAVCGGRHAMGGQQFLTNGVLLDLRSLNAIRRLDLDTGMVDTEAGITWPILMRELDAIQSESENPWVIRQKQTGADELTLGGALAANIHGRGLTMQPFVDDIVSFRICTADGSVKTCSRELNSGLFRLAIGGYGIFGIVLSVKVRLMRRQILKRVVEVTDRTDLLGKFEQAIAAGAQYGDFQFCCDERSSDLLRRGVFSYYVPTSESVPNGQEFLTAERWRQLIHLAHVDKSKAFEVYADHYTKSSGQLYESDRMQLAPYLDGYHAEIDRRLEARCRGSEMITEISVPRRHLEGFLQAAAEYIQRVGAHLIYGTVRLIERDPETFLAWAKEQLACVIFNLHVDHEPEAIARSGEHFRGLIDIGLRFGGTFYLTYHRFASREQLLRAYPQFPYFLAAKTQYDPDELFQSDWYEFYRRLFSEEIQLATGEQPIFKQRL
ncbi:MAG: FAD-binding oxidoreductase [Bdellovibrionota bacterium]